MARLRGGEAVVAALLDCGVDTVFGLPGIQNDWLYNALFDARERIRVVHTRHEQGAGYLALGASLASGRPAVYSVVPGPGLLNASAALATAYALGAPVLCLSGQIPSTAIGRGQGVLHEIPDQLGILRRLTKWAERIDSPAEAPVKIARAFQELRSGRPRPVGLEVPMDVLEQRTEVELESAAMPPYHPPVDDEAIVAAARLLGAAEKPMIFVGGGVQGASAEVRRLAELLQAPVVAYRTGKGVLDARHYLSLEQPAAARYWPDSDAVIAVGSNMRVPLRKWWPRHQPKLLRIDVDPRSHRLFVTPDVAITARAEDALPKLLDALETTNRRRASRRDELEALRAWWAREVAVLEPQLSYLRVIREALGEDGIFVDELTQVGFASRIAFPVYRPRSYLSTGYQGTLGYGFPTALGAKVARPELPVVSISGDGGFLFAVQELATAVQHDIALVTVVFDNGGYGNVRRMQQELYGGRVIATDLLNPDFVKLAASFGAQALRAETPEALAQALREGFAARGPTVVHVPIGEVPSADRFR